uniref:Ankyrin repeat and sterile alpha motif domain containing 3 n=1 Tax=Erpetoichthys calabaricus TaxID=27687 RepID=A0A8C4SW58_ERPCA
MSELSDEASDIEQPDWLGAGQLIKPDELDTPLDLHTASSIGQYSVVLDCIRSGKEDLNRKNMGGWTPLMYAAYIGHHSVVNLLLEAGVNVNITTVKGQTPLMLAASCGNERIAYSLLQQGAELELTDARGWTALFHCTSTGHQQMVKFFLDNNANANVREPFSGFTPLMEAAASGHEIIVQYLLEHGVKVDERNSKGETARALAMMYGHTKIASLIDMHVVQSRPRLGHFDDLSSSEDSDSAPHRPRSSRTKSRGPSIHDGPQAIAKFRVGPSTKQYDSAVMPPGYVTFRDGSDHPGGFRNRDVTSPINEQDVDSNSSQGDSPFFENDMPTMRSSSSSSEGIPQLLGRSRDASLESNEDSDQAKQTVGRRQNKMYNKGKSRCCSDNVQAFNKTKSEGYAPTAQLPAYTGPKDLAEFLDSIGLLKYLALLEDQDIDLRIFLTLTENDLKEVGITLFGPKRKMTSAIARWHSSARPPSDGLEQAYADQLEAKMQEMAIQLHKKCEEVEMLQSQVSQERELRTVVEGCLMEDKMAWRRFQDQVEDTQGLAKEALIALDKVQTCQTEFLNRLKKDISCWQPSGGEVKSKMQTEEKVGKGWKEDLKSQGLSELVTTLEQCHAETRKALLLVTRNLDRLQDVDKGAREWAES